MNESLLKLSIEVPLNALPYHEFLCRLELRWILTPEEDSQRFHILCDDISCDHDAWIYRNFNESK